MSTSYGQVYAKLVQQMNTKYSSYYNLYLLKSFRQKILCYKNLPQQKIPSQYYSCFQKIEHRLITSSKQFTKDYENIQDQYNICVQNCKDTQMIDKDRSQNCMSNCAIKWKQSVENLYSNFYKSKIGMEKQYKKLKK